MRANSKLFILRELSSRVNKIVVDIVKKVKDLTDVALAGEVLGDLHKCLNDGVVACIAVKLLLKMKQVLLNRIVCDLNKHRVH